MNGTKFTPEQFIEMWQKNPDSYAISRQLTEKGHNQFTPEVVMACAICFRAFGIKLRKPETKTEDNSGNTTQI